MEVNIESGSVEPELDPEEAFMNAYLNSEEPVEDDPAFAEELATKFAEGEEPLSGDEDIVPGEADEAPEAELSGGDPEGDILEDQVPEDATPRAQARIQNLVQEKNELLDLVKKLTEAQEKDFALKQQILNAQQEQDQLRLKNETDAQYEQRLLDMGFDAEDLGMVMSRNAVEKASSVELRMAQLERELETMRQEKIQTAREQAEKAYVENYRKEVNDGLDAALKNRAVDKELRQDLLDQAYAMARVKGFQDPKDAVKSVSRIIARLPKRRSKLPQAPDVPESALKSMGLRGSTSGKNAGDLPSGRRIEQGDDDPEESFFRDLLAKFKG